VRFNHIPAPDAHEPQLLFRSGADILLVNDQSMPGAGTAVTAAVLQKTAQAEISSGNCPATCAACPSECAACPACEATCPLTVKSNIVHAAGSEADTCTNSSCEADSLKTVVYQVADLVVPVNGEFDESKINGLAELIEATVSPASWIDNGGTGSLMTHPSTRSIVIRQTADVHSRIAGVLDELRRVFDAQVCLEIRLLEVPDTLADQWEMPTIATAQQANFRQLQVKECREASLQFAPKITLFNGHCGTIGFSSQQADQSGRENCEAAACRLRFQPVISADRRFIRLSWSATPSTDEGILGTQTHVIPDGNTLMVSLDGQEASANGSRCAMWITPRIIIQEEEEELLGVPRNDLAAAESTEDRQCPSCWEELKAARKARSAGGQLAFALPCPGCFLGEDVQCFTAELECCDVRDKVGTACSTCGNARPALPPALGPDRFFSSDAVRLVPIAPGIFQLKEFPLSVSLPQPSLPVEAKAAVGRSARDVVAGMRSPRHFQSSKPLKLSNSQAGRSVGASAWMIDSIAAEAPEKIQQATWTIEHAPSRRIGVELQR
jgi:hypothetical protein